MQCRSSWGRQCPRPAAIVSPDFICINGFESPPKDRNWRKTTLVGCRISCHTAHAEAPNIGLGGRRSGRGTATANELCIRFLVVLLWPRARKRSSPLVPGLRLVTDVAMAAT